MNRRAVLTLFGLSGGVWLTRRAFAQAPAGCVVRPQQTEGPYFVDEGLNRADIRSDPATGTVKPGAPLEIVFRVSDLSGGRCVPLSGGMVDVWHCDAQGAYSDARDSGGDTRRQRVPARLSADGRLGIVRFTTIYPGWYEGRAVHVHLKIRTTPAAGRGREFTSRLYFDDALTEQVHAQAPYIRRGRRAPNDSGASSGAAGTTSSSASPKAIPATPGRLTSRSRAGCRSEHERLFTGLDIPR